MKGKDGKVEQTGGTSTCICPECGYSVEHGRGTPCNEMKCPKCKYEKQRVIDSRTFGEETRRQRICMNCNFKFITYERADAVEDAQSVRTDAAKDEGGKEELCLS